jgi:hypothetical protein
MSATQNAMSDAQMALTKVRADTGDMKDAVLDLADSMEDQDARAITHNISVVMDYALRIDIRLGKAAVELLRAQTRLDEVEAAMIEALESANPLGEHEHKRCPFCGGTAYADGIPGQTYVRCGGCDVKTAVYSRLDAAWAAWDRRAADEPTRLGVSGWPFTNCRCRMVTVRQDPLGEYAPDWDEAPEDAVAWSVDADGRAWWCSKRPRATQSTWYARACEVSYSTTIPLDELGIDWRDTLRLRPTEEVSHDND